MLSLCCVLISGDPAAPWTDAPSCPTSWRPEGCRLGCSSRRLRLRSNPRWPWKGAPLHTPQSPWDTPSPSLCSDPPPCVKQEVSDWDTRLRNPPYRLKLKRPHFNSLCSLQISGQLISDSSAGRPHFMAQRRRAAVGFQWGGGSALPLSWSQSIFHPASMETTVPIRDLCVTPAFIVFASL